MSGRVDDVCTACKAKIRWAVVEPSGKRMPLEAYPEPDGLVYVTTASPLHVRVARHRDTIPAGAVRYRPHFTTCPARRARRRPKPPPQGELALFHEEG